MVEDYVKNTVSLYSDDVRNAVEHNIDAQLALAASLGAKPSLGLQL